MDTLFLHVKNPIPSGVLTCALYSAISSRCPVTVRLLIDAGANASDGNNHPALQAAAVGSVAILKTLQAYGADFAAHNSLALCNAANGGHLPALKFLLRTGACLDAVPAATRIAVASGHAEMLEWLLRHGGKLASPTLISQAACNDSVEALLLLMKHGYPLAPHADAVFEKATNHLAHRVLAFLLKHARVSQAVLNRGLIRIVRHANAAQVDLLLQHGAQAGDNVALEIAVKSQKWAIAEKLIATGAHVPDLQPKLISKVLEVENWPFLRLILCHGLTVRDLILPTDQATAFLHHITPAELLHDQAGNFIPQKLVRERQNFVKITGQLVAKTSDDNAVATAQWITAFSNLINEAR